MPSSTESLGAVSQGVRTPSTGTTRHRPRRKPGAKAFTLTNCRCQGFLSFRGSKKALGPPIKMCDLTAEVPSTPSARLASIFLLPTVGCSPAPPIDSTWCSRKLLTIIAVGLAQQHRSRGQSQGELQPTAHAQVAYILHS